MNIKRTYIPLQLFLFILVLFGATPGYAHLNNYAFFHRLFFLIGNFNYQRKFPLLLEIYFSSGCSFYSRGLDETCLKQVFLNITNLWVFS